MNRLYKGNYLAQTAILEILQTICDTFYTPDTQDCLEKGVGGAEGGRGGEIIVF